MTREERLRADGYDPETVEPVLFFGPDDECWWASNFSPWTVTLPNPWEPEILVTHPTGEHPFQAGKATTRQEWEYVAGLWPEGKPIAAYTAKKRGKRVDPLRAGWDEWVAYALMVRIVRAKALDHWDVREALLATGDRPMYEDSPVDDIWGWRFRNNYGGKNQLGKAWMAVRGELRGEYVRTGYLDAPLLRPYCARPDCDWPRTPDDCPHDRGQDRDRPFCGRDPEWKPESQQGTLGV